MNLKSIQMVLATVVLVCLSTLVSASPVCPVSINAHKKEWNLLSHCVVDQTFYVPDGYRLNFRGYEIIGQDPSGGHFLGAIVQAEFPGASLELNGPGKVTTGGLQNVCDAGDNRLAGVRAVGGKLTVNNLEVEFIKQLNFFTISGCQEGNAIEMRNLDPWAEKGKLTVKNSRITEFQKTGILANGNVDVDISENYIAGEGAQAFIAQNGIQLGYGATGKITNNRVIGVSYSGISAVSGGILIVGGPGYGGDFCRNVHIQKNWVQASDVGVYISQYEADFSAPASPTNIKVINNTLEHLEVTNGYVYHAGVSVVGNNDKIINNDISGAAYDPATLPGSTFAVDSFGNKIKVHAN